MPPNRKERTRAGIVSGTGFGWVTGLVACVQIQGRFLKIHAKEQPGQTHEKAHYRQKEYAAGQATVPPMPRRWPCALSDMRRGGPGPQGQRRLWQSAVHPLQWLFRYQNRKVFSLWRRGICL